MTVNIQEEFFNITGINVAIEAVETKEWMPGYREQDELTLFTDFYANGFSFEYKGARIIGSLPRLPVGHYIPSADTGHEVPLLPIIEKACGFSIDLNQVEG